MVVLLPGFLHGFKPLHSPGSITHRVITQRAILRKTAEVCRDIAASAGRDFTLTVSRTRVGVYYWWVVPSWMVILNSLDEYQQFRTSWLEIFWCGIHTGHLMAATPVFVSSDWRQPFGRRCGGGLLCRCLLFFPLHRRLLPLHHRCILKQRRCGPWFYVEFQASFWWWDVSGRTGYHHSRSVS